MKNRDSHMSEPGTLEPDADGWWHARCVCGWQQGPFPDIEVVVDALMDHVADVVWEQTLRESGLG